MYLFECKTFWKLEIGITTFFRKVHFKFFIMFPQSKTKNISSEQWIFFEYSLIYIESRTNMPIHSTPKKKIFGYRRSTLSGTYNHKLLDK